MTPTDDYENNDIFLKSDTPCREIQPFYGFAVVVVCATEKRLIYPLRGVSHTVTSRENVLHRFPA